MTKKYGWYSEKAVKEGHGSHIYSTPDGGEVEVTTVGTETHKYYWDDKVFVGEVLQGLRDGQEAWARKT